MDRVLLVSIVVAIVMVAKVVAMDGGHSEGNDLKRLLFRRS